MKAFRFLLTLAVVALSANLADAQFLRRVAAGERPVREALGIGSCGASAHASSCGSASASACGASAQVGACGAATATTGGVATATAPTASWPTGPLFHEIFRHKMVGEIQKKIDPETGKNFTWYKAHQMAGSVSNALIESSVKSIQGSDRMMGASTSLQDIWAWFIANLPAILSAIMQILALFGL